MSEEPDAKRARVDYSGARVDEVSTEVDIEKKFATHMMCKEARELLKKECGVQVVWNPQTSKVALYGSKEQVKACQKVLQRVVTHCNWGSSVEKVLGLIKPKIVEEVMIRLSPMGDLRKFAKKLNANTPQLTIGKDKGMNELVINDQHVSRQHCILELDVSKGAVYIIDTSTNGTFLNGVKLPAKSAGKVIASHGDELLLKDSNLDKAQEFGWILNIAEVSVKEERVFKAPRRLMSDIDHQHTFFGT